MPKKYDYWRQGHFFLTSSDFVYQEWYGNSSCAANELSVFLAPTVTFNTDCTQEQLFILTFNT